MHEGCTWLQTFAMYHAANPRLFKGKCTFSQTPKKKSTFTVLDVTGRCILFFSFHKAIQYVLFINPIIPKAPYSKSEKQALNSE